MPRRGGSTACGAPDAGGSVAGGSEAGGSEAGGSEVGGSAVDGGSVAGGSVGSCLQKSAMVLLLDDGRHDSAAADGPSNSSASSTMTSCTGRDSLRRRLASKFS